MLAEVRRSGSARGLFVTHVTSGLPKLRLGALPEADAAARVGLRVQVMLSIWVSNLACSGSPALTIHPADLQTNASGNGQADHVFTPQNVEQAGLLGQTVSATWLLSTGGTPSYQTGCEVVTLS